MQAYIVHSLAINQVGCLGAHDGIDLRVERLLPAKLGHCGLELLREGLLHADKVKAVVERCGKSA
jgi:hypothetical protein